jgi:hypothetical protein
MGHKGALHRATTEYSHRYGYSVNRMVVNAPWQGAQPMLDTKPLAAHDLDAKRQDHHDPQREPRM